MKRITSILMFILLTTMMAQGQISIGGNVYGGGNKGKVGGSTSVTVKSGDLNKVFGGARMADVGGNAYVNIDGKNATGYMVINYVFGGNDIAGNIGTAKAVGESLPTEIDGNADGVDDTWNTYVHISSKKTDGALAADNQKIYIGQLFAGGNGDFTYTDENGSPLTDDKGNYIVKEGETVIATNTNKFVTPEVDKAYLDVQGGSIVYAYGGGNNATVKEQTVIHYDNPSDVVNHILVSTAEETKGVEAVKAIYDDYKTRLADNDKDNDELPTGYIDLLDNKRFLEMGINTTFSFPSSGEFQVGRFFGGNNLAEMKIRPTWNLLSGKIRNLYSGGNKGAMTSPDGLLLEIKDYSTLVVDNLYGGCRMADVRPEVNGVYTPTKNLSGYYFPNEFSARTLVRGGHINNVYGGNDVTGTVYGGNAVGIYTTVYGDVYGGGNGAYPYTDSQSFKDDATYGDFFFEQGDYESAADALNAFRPNAEQVSLRLAGSVDKPTVVKGSIFVGGNCASLATKKEEPKVELKIGSYVIADKVFLGNNGEKMVDPQLLGLYKTNSSLILTDKSAFADYMNGVAMPLKPSVVFDNTDNDDPATYVDNTSMIGSFYGGGNKGSMIISGKTTLKFDRKLIIFDKLVGGCNDANVEETELNAAYEGGLLGAADERGDQDHPEEYYTDDGTEMAR